MQLGDRFDRLESVRAFGDDVDVGHRGQILAQHGARQLLVVDDRDT